MREKNYFKCFVMRLCILHYYKCKAVYIELGVMKVVLIKLIIRKNN